MAKKGKKSKRAPRVAPTKLVSLKKPPKGQVKDSAKSKPSASQAATEETTALARISQLEADRTNLMAQVAWARGVAQEQQKALEVERQRSEKLAAELEIQRARVERLKALTLLDRVLGRHKSV
ncbi:MAG: hypothetical protein EG823_02810 [Actinobacteria bacterium]|nr:hypothetical protein [Actinomycetota bacterium]